MATKGLFVVCLLPLLAAAIWPPPRSILKDGELVQLCQELAIQHPPSILLKQAWQRAQPLLRRGAAANSPSCVGSLSFDVADLSENLDGETRYDYRVEIARGRIHVASATVFGAMYALESLVQLAAAANGVHERVLIDDAPLYSWRGLMLDSGRRFFPVAHVKSLLDTMAAVKLNVLHLHASDMCRFGVQSHLYPNLTDSLTGILGGFYTQSDVADLVTYARARGIRLVPEFDIPGHSRGFIPVESQGAEFCVSSPSRSQLYGDPNNRTYTLLHGLLREMAALFPDPVLHIGCDETGVIGPCTLNSTFALERRVLSMIEQELGKTPAGWEEVYFNAGAATPSTIVFTWARHHPPEVTKTGRRVVENAGSHFYFTEPASPGPAGWTSCWYNISTDVPAAEQHLVLGGEMSMWTDTYCYTSQCGASSGSTPVGAALFPPSRDAEFLKSIGGMVWPRGFVGAAAFWGYNASLNPSDPAFVQAVYNVSAELIARGLPVCPPGCRCDQLSACGVPYMGPTPGAAVGLAQCDLDAQLTTQRWVFAGGRLCLSANSTLCLSLAAPGTYPARLTVASAATPLVHPQDAAIGLSDLSRCLDVRASDGAVGSFACGEGQQNQAWAIDPDTSLVVLLGNYGDDRDARAGLCLTALSSD